MKLLLCSDFTGVGYRYLKNFQKNANGQNCLFVGYACEEDEEMYESGAKNCLAEFGYSIIDLTPNYDFKDKIDAIFVRGGNTTKLIDYLKKYNQFNKLKQLVINEDALYIGNSAGSVLCGTDTAWTLDAEPYRDITKDYGKDALKGYGFVDKLVFVHCTKYRMCRDYEQQSPSDIFRTLDTDCYEDYLRDTKKYNKEQYIRIGNNQVYFVNGNVTKTITYNWRNIPVKII